MDARTPAPPRLAQMIVRARLRGARRSAAESDMLELFRARAASRGVGYARRRYWVDALSLWWHAPAQVSPVTTRVRPRVSHRLASDLRWTWRALRARPAASLAVTTILALGIGLAATMFALADPYVLRPLPYPDPAALVTISPPEVLATSPAADPNAALSDLTTLTNWQARTDLFTGVAAFGTGEVVQVETPDRLTSIKTARVSASFFPLLRLPQPVGDWRIVTGQIETPIVVPAGVGAIGTRLTSPDGRQWRIAGVLPDAFVFPDAGARVRVTALAPLADEHVYQVLEQAGGFRATQTLSLVARLRRGVSADTVKAALAPLLPSGLPTGGSLRPAAFVEPLSTVMTKRTHAIALGAVAAGLLIFLACAANIANLLLTRVTYRARELATRQAVGATRGDLFRLVLIEVATVTAAAIAMGLGLAFAALRLAGLIMPAEYATLGAPAMTSRVAIFAVVMGVLVMLAGVIPAMMAWRTMASTAFTDVRTVDSARSRAVRGLLTAGQMAVTMVLLIGGVLLVRSYERLVAQDTGFAPDAFAMTAVYPTTQYARLTDIVTETLDRLRHVPGVRHAAAVLGPLADGNTVSTMRFVNGRPLFVGGKQVTPDYPAATGGTLVAGRFFTSGDRADEVLVVNEAFAKLCCADRSAVGQIVRGNRPSTIVGVLKDAFDSALDTPPAPMIFTPLVLTGSVAGSGLPIGYVFRTTDAIRAFPAAAERHVIAVDASAIVSDASTLGARLSRTVQDRSFATLVLVLFGTTAIVVSATGLVAIVGSTVARRTREIAIRVAIGARPSQVRWLVTRDAIVAASTGAAAGFAAGWWLSGTLTHLLYGIRPADPVSFAIAIVLMLTTAGIAAAIPASRALRISPNDALSRE
ncbi:MAG TPA: FtsX-like permease family protein [Vicinamibacterales bacterium]|jgi:putative ABC transport system permease protein|nr:FtsX-like permease family protein [Vicinamibacterales bacterium]